MLRLQYVNDPTEGESIINTNGDINAGLSFVRAHNIFSVGEFMYNRLGKISF